MVSPFESDPVLVEVVRNGFIESVHRGRVAITDPDGRLASSVGADFAPMYPRSANKPLQAVGMLRAGLDLDGELLALVCASHSGESFHLEGVRRILALSGLDESALQMPADWPLDQQAREDAIRERIGQVSACHELLGKARRDDQDDRLERPGTSRTTAILIIRFNWRSCKPLMILLTSRPRIWRSTVAAPRCMRSRSTPSPALSARSPAHRDGAEHRVATAIRSHPEYVSGTGRDELDLHRAIPGLMAKAGAESVYAVGLPDGRGVAIKISDGNPRARPVAMAGVLQRLGFDHETLDAQASAPVLGGGERVGEIRPCKETLAELGADQSRSEPVAEACIHDHLLAAET